MGYNTAAIILNDGLGEIRKDLKLGENIYQAVTLSSRGQQDIRAGNHINSMSVIPSEHADVDQVIIVGANYIRPVYRTSGLPHRVTPEQLQEAVMKDIAQRLGYDVKKRK